MISSKVSKSSHHIKPTDKAVNVNDKTYSEGYGPSARVKRNIIMDDPMNVSYDFSVILTVEDEDSVSNTHPDDFDPDPIYIPLKEDPLVPHDNKFDEDSGHIDLSQDDVIDKFIPIVNPSTTAMSNKVKLPDPAKYPKDRGREDFVVIDDTDELVLSPVVSYGVMLPLTLAACVVVDHIYVLTVIPGVS